MYSCYFRILHTPEASENCFFGQKRWMYVESVFCYVHLSMNLLLSDLQMFDLLNLLCKLRLNSQHFLTKPILFDEVPSKSGYPVKLQLTQNLRLLRILRMTKMIFMKWYLTNHFKNIKIRNLKRKY